MPCKIIAVEGVDGVGKSSLCNILSHFSYRQAVAVAKTPYDECAKLPQLTKQPGSIGAFCSFLIGDIAVRNQFANLEWVVLDRYILSTVVYHANVIKGFENDILKIFELTDVLKPTITIMLDASVSTLEKRLILRGDFASSSSSIKELQTKFNYYFEEPSFQPWLGRKVRLRSETLDDQREAVNLLSEILTP